MNWALITGGSKGIGFGLAESFARRNYNILLVARDQRQLDDSKLKLESRYQIQVEVLSCDLTDAESATTLYEWCLNRRIEVTILCNAAGQGGSRDFPLLSVNEIRTMIRLNVESALTLTLIFLPVLKRTAPSYILHVCSMAGFAPLPIKNVYSSSKSALMYFCYSLKYLLKEHNISVSCLCPGPVFTKLSIEQETKRQLGWLGKQMAVSPEDLGEYSVKCLFKKKLIIVPGNMASLFSFVIRSLPKRMVAYLSYRFSSQDKLKSI